MRKDDWVFVFAAIGAVAALLTIIQSIGHLWTPVWSFVSSLVYFAGACAFIGYRWHQEHAGMAEAWRQMVAEAQRKTESGDQTFKSLLPQYPAYYSLRKRSEPVRRVFDGDAPVPEGGIERLVIAELDRLT